MTTMQLETMKTLKAVAEELGLTDSRISQLCKKAGIVGTYIGSERLLSPAEVRRLKAIPRRQYTKSTDIFHDSEEI